MCVCVCVCVRTRAHLTTCISARIRRRVPAPGRVRIVSPQTCQVLFAAVAAPRWSHRLHLTAALVPLHTHTQRAASTPRLTVQCTHPMLRFPPAQPGAPATVLPSLITSPSIVQHLSPAPPSRGPRIRTVVLNRPPHPFLQLEQAHSFDARQEILPCRTLA